jgi:hypothetical protein
MIGRFASTQADPQWVSNIKQPFELILVVIVLAVSIGASYAEPKKHHFIATRGERHRSHQLQQSNKNDGVGWHIGVGAGWYYGGPYVGGQ